MGTQLKENAVFDHTLEEVEYNGELVDVDLEVSYEIEPYDPGVRTFRNGDPGYPPSGGGVESLEVKVTGVTWHEATDRKATDAEKQELQSFIERNYSDVLDAEALEHANAGEE